MMTLVTFIKYYLSLKAGLGCRIKSNCHTRDIGTTGRMPSMGVFLRDPNRIYMCFGENHEKLQTVRLKAQLGI